MDDLMDELPPVRYRILMVDELPELPHPRRKDDRDRPWSRKVHWRRVSDQAVALVEQHPDGEVTIAEIMAWAKSAGLAGRDREAFGSLFLWPIDVTLPSEACDGSGSWVNGRHRGAWIIDSGVDRIVAERLPGR